MSQEESSNQKDYHHFYSQPASNFQSDYNESHKIEWYSQPKVEWNSWSETGASTDKYNEDNATWSQETLKPSTSGYSLSQQDNDLLIDALNKYENGN